MIIITGGAGFIGSNLVEFFSEKLEKQVCIITCCKIYDFFISTQIESFGADGNFKIDPLNNNPIEDIFSHYPSFGFSPIH